MCCIAAFCPRMTACFDTLPPCCPCWFAFDDIASTRTSARLSTSFVYAAEELVVNVRLCSSRNVSSKLNLSGLIFASWSLPVKAAVIDSTEGGDSDGDVVDDVGAALDGVVVDDVGECEGDEVGASVLEVGVSVKAVGAVEVGFELGDEVGASVLEVGVSVKAVGAVEVGFELGEEDGAIVGVEEGFFVVVEGEEEGFFVVIVGVEEGFFVVAEGAVVVVVGADVGAHVTATK
jgi:hypothetical protein